MVLYIIRGIPGSGKSKLAEIIAPEHHYSADDYFYNKAGEYKYDKYKLTEAHDSCYKNVENAMMDGIETIAVANTFTRKIEYSDYILLAEKMGYTPIEIICKGHFTSIHNVPERTMNAMTARFEYE